MNTPLEYFRIDKELNRAVRFHQSGQLEEARTIYKKILEVDPNHSDALHLLGFMSHQFQNNRQAFDLIKKAIRIHPDTPYYYNSLGQVLESENRLDEAVAAYQTALKLKPDLVEALNNLGIALTKQEKSGDAIPVLKKAVSLAPRSAQVYNTLGNAHAARGEFEPALNAYKTAIVNNPRYAEPHFHMGNLYHKQGKYLEAVQCHQRALELDPTHIQALLNKGIAHHELDQLTQAIACYGGVLKIDPSYTPALDNMGKAYEDLGRIDDAIVCYGQTLRIAPENADARFDRSLLLLLKGNLEEGFKEYEWRFSKSHWQHTYPHRFTHPRWDGSPFPGKRLLIHTEQGLGDAIQFARYLPLVKRLGGEVIFETKKPLFSLFQGFQGIDKMVVFSSAEKYSGEFDFYIPLMSLPKVLRTTLETIPADIPYLYGTTRKAEYWRSRLEDDGFKIGLVWAGSPTNNDDKNRSCDPRVFLPLKELPGVLWYALQKGDAANQVGLLRNDMKIINLGEEIKDFEDTAGIIENLDLTISVDTAVAHLAGAMGKPVWTLLPFAPDWRWLTNRQNTPWYPTMRLFRQVKRGDWNAPIQSIRQELGTLL